MMETTVAVAEAISMAAVVVAEAASMAVAVCSGDDDNGGCCCCGVDIDGGCFCCGGDIDGAITVIGLNAFDLASVVGASHELIKRRKYGVGRLVWNIVHKRHSFVVVDGKYDVAVAAGRTRVRS